jgi:hypothetical protein
MYSKNKEQWCYENYIDYKAMLRVLSTRKQLLKYLKKYKFKNYSTDDKDVIRKCIVYGFFANAAERQNNGSYLSLRGFNFIKI